MKTPSLIHYFLVNLMCFTTRIHPPLKIYHFRLYIVEKKDLGGLIDDVRFVSNQVLMQKTFPF